MNVLTLCLIRKDGKLLLGLKKLRLGAGNLNGFGGKVEPGESIEEAARREVLEECGLTVSALRKVARLSFVSPLRPEIDLHVYEATEFTGEPIETDEMIPEWFDETAVPYERMWSSDAHWLPPVLAGRCVTGRISFDEHDQVLEQNLSEADTLA